MATTRGERLRLARERRYKSGRIAAKELGVAISTYGAHERAESAGGRDYGPDEAKFYARRLGVTPEWLLTGRWLGPDGKPAKVGEPEKVAVRLKVPVVGYIGSGSRAHFYDVAQADLDEVEPPPGSTRATVALEIRANVLAPYFNRWLVFYDDIHNNPTSEKLIGELCVIGLEDDRVVIKQLQPGRLGLYNLTSTTEKTMPDTAVSWVAKINSVSRRSRKDRLKS
jgi:hypothetical protein